MWSLFCSINNQLGTRWIGRLVSLFLEHPAFFCLDKIAVLAQTLLDWWKLGGWSGGNDWEGRWYQGVEQEYRSEHEQHTLSTFSIFCQTFCMSSFSSCKVYISICCEHCKSNCSLSLFLAYWTLVVLALFYKIISQGESKIWTIHFANRIPTPKYFFAR